VKIYHRRRKELSSRVYDRAIARLDEDFRPDRPTVILLPGAPGTRLDRSCSPLDHREGYRFNPLWLRPGAVPLPFLGWGGDMPNIGLEPDGRDIGGHCLIPNGPLHMAFRSAANGRWHNDYYRAEDFFRREADCNYLFFAFDWRRHIEEAADWLGYLLRGLATSVSQRHGRPLTRVILTGHSFGGMVAKVYLERLSREGRLDQLEGLIDQVITISTPFYGTPRFFGNLLEGLPVFNRLYTPRRAHPIYASFPGPYAATYSDPALFDRLGPTLGLSEAPLVDRATRRPLASFWPETFSRFPTWVRHASTSRDEQLLEGERIQAMISGDLLDNWVGKFYHIRSVYRRMHDCYAWEGIDGEAFEPTGKNSPVCGLGKPTGWGDGSVHRWSAALAQVVERYGRSHIYDCSIPIKHPGLMNARPILNAVREIIETGVAPEGQ